MKISDLKVGVKLYSSFFIVIFVFGMVCLFQIMQMGNMKDLEDQSAQRAADLENLAEIKMLSGQLYEVVADSIINRNLDESIKKFEEIKKEIEHAKEDVKKLADTKEEKEWASNIGREFGEFTSLYENKVLPELKKGGAADDNVLKFVDGQIDEVRGHLMKELLKFDKSLEEETKEASGEYDRAYLATLRITIIVILIGLAIGFVFSFIMTRYIKRCLDEVVDVSNKLAEGDLTGRTNLDQQDEFGIVGRTMNKSLDNMEIIVSDITVAMQNLAQAVEQISSGNQSLSQRSSEQASSIEEVASTIEQATVTIKQNAENAQEASKNADDATKMVEQAKVLSEEAIKLAEEGGAVVVDAVSSIDEVNKSSSRISEILSVINEIAFQTNLLALNAAVEAARAGEQGRGFAVVAGEVRNLAQRSGDAAKEIGDVIKDSIAKVERGTELVNKSGNALTEIISSVKTNGESLTDVIKAVRGVSNLISEIATASEEQKQGIDQINTAIAEMDTMTQQNAALVEETSSASEEMANQSQDVMAMLNDKFTIRDSIRSKVSDKARKEIHIKAAEFMRQPIEAKSFKIKEGNGSGEQSTKKVKAKDTSIKEVMEKDGFEEF